MNKFEDHWRKKMNDPEAYTDFLKEKARSDMWEKMKASKTGFEQVWQKKTDNIEVWKGILDEERKQALWDKLPVAFTQFERQWLGQIEGVNRLSGTFPDEPAKVRMAAGIFGERVNFESDWQDKMTDPELVQDQLSTDSKERIWLKVQSSNTGSTDPAHREKRKPLLILRWSHAAALLIGAFSTWLVWNLNNNTLQNTLVVAPQSEAALPAVKSTVPQEEIKKTTTPQEVVSTERDALPEAATKEKESAKDKTFVPAKQSRAIEGRVGGDVVPVQTVQAATVLATATPENNSSTTNTPGDKSSPVPAEPGIELAINKAAPAKKVVHISDIRPAAAPVKGAAIYGRAFGEGSSKNNEKSTMNFNSVLKNYK